MALAKHAISVFVRKCANSNHEQEVHPSISWIFETLSINNVMASRADLPYLKEFRVGVDLFPV